MDTTICDDFLAALRFGKILLPLTLVGRGGNLYDSGCHSERRDPCGAPSSLSDPCQTPCRYPSRPPEGPQLFPTARSKAGCLEACSGTAQSQSVEIKNLAAEGPHVDPKLEDRHRFEQPLSNGIRVSTSLSDTFDARCKVCLTLCDKVSLLVLFLFVFSRVVFVWFVFCCVLVCCVLSCFVLSLCCFCFF